LDDESPDELELFPEEDASDDEEDDDADEEAGLPDEEPRLSFR
jgi:hypothetical protein